MSTATDHQIEDLPPAPSTAPPCQHCKGAVATRPRAVAITSFRFTTGRAGRRGVRESHVCLEHACKFAAKHSLALPPGVLEILEPTDQEVIAELDSMAAEFAAEIVNRGPAPQPLRRHRVLHVARDAFRRILEAGSSAAGDQPDGVHTHTLRPRHLEELLDEDTSDDSHEFPEDRPARPASPGELTLGTPIRVIGGRFTGQRGVVSFVPSPPHTERGSFRVYFVSEGLGEWFEAHELERVNADGSRIDATPEEMIATGRQPPGVPR